MKKVRMNSPRIENLSIYNQAWKNLIDYSRRVTEFGYDIDNYDGFVLYPDNPYKSEKEIVETLANAWKGLMKRGKEDDRNQNQ